MISPAAQPLFMEFAAKPLLILHALFAMALLGSTTHDAILCIGFLRGRFGRRKLERIYALIASCCYAATFLVGSILYPTYRVRVRAAYFDRALPWASNLFDVKENWAAIGLAASLGLLLLSRSVEPQRERFIVPLYAFLSITACAIAWFATISGLVLASYRAV